MGLIWKRIWTIDDPQSMGARLVLKPAMEGLRLLGVEVREFILDRNDPELAVHARQDFQAFHPDMIWLANHPSSVILHQLGLTQISCPVGVWLLDDPLLMGDELFSEREMVFVTDPRFEEGARIRNARQVFFLPVAAPDRIQAEFREEYAVPVAYVGSVQVNRQARDRVPPPMRNYLWSILEKKVKTPEMDFGELLERFPYQTNRKIALTGPLNYFLYSEANRMYRFQFLQTLSSTGLRIYGNEVWKQEIRGTPIQDCFAGKIDPLQDYLSLIRSASININLRSLQGFSAPVHRDFLVPRLGGFLISSTVQKETINWNTVDPENRYHLQDFPWSFSCRTPEEMNKTVRYYLDHESERRQWTEEAARKIMENHTYSLRMTQLGDLLEDKIKA